MPLPHEGAKKEECREDQQNLRGVNIISEVTACESGESFCEILSPYSALSWLEENKKKNFRLATHIH